MSKKVKYDKITPCPNCGGGNIQAANTTQRGKELTLCRCFDCDAHWGFER